MFARPSPLKSPHVRSLEGVDGEERVPAAADAGRRSRNGRRSSPSRGARDAREQARSHWVRRRHHHHPPRGASRAPSCSTARSAARFQYRSASSAASPSWTEALVRKPPVSPPQPPVPEPDFKNAGAMSRQVRSSPEPLRHGGPAPSVAGALGRGRARAVLPFRRRCTARDRTRASAPRATARRRAWRPLRAHRRVVVGCG